MIEFLSNFDDNDKFKLLRLIAKTSSQGKCEEHGRQHRAAWADLEMRFYSALNLNLILSSVVSLHIKCFIGFEYILLTHW